MTQSSTKPVSCNLTYLDILTNFRAILGLNAYFWCYFLCGYFEPSLALRLKTLNVEPVGIGMIFASTGISWCIGATVCGLILKYTNFKRQ